jgi:histidinol dehydrogenase
MKIIHVTNVEKFVAQALPKQPQKNRSIVESILKTVQKNGDSAFSKVSKNKIDAILFSKSRLEKTESAVKSILKNKSISTDGIKISKKFTPIQSVGCYIPGGLAKYPSSVIMSVVPAKIAGVKRIVVVSPPNSDGKIDPLTIVAANLCGANEIYKVGGAQAIAALSFGTKSISKVDKIVGPGGAFVTIAKSMVSERTSIDMIAGPTELGIIADQTANPRYIALDLISQSEHSNDTFCYLITNSEKLAKSVDKIIAELSNKIKRSDFVKTSLKENGFIAICKNNSDMIKLANELAPEHLQIMTKNPDTFVSKITSSGLVLIGSYTPSSASDYLLGSNHILPTNGFGKTRGSLSVLDFIKINTQISTSKSVMSKISKHMEVFTEAEGLPNHFEAVRGRIQ